MKLLSMLATHTGRVHALRGGETILLLLREELIHNKTILANQ